MLTFANIESELSYAYLHAVAAQAGFSCEPRGRHVDNACIDATVCSDTTEGLCEDSIKFFVELHVQLKATYQDLPETENAYSFPLDKRTYNKLRRSHVSSPQILVLLKLPREKTNWLQVDANNLVAKDCAYWMSIVNFPEIEGASKTVYVPKANLLTPQALTELMKRASKLEAL